jgi:hypothetical protein
MLHTPNSKKSQGENPEANDRSEERLGGKDATGVLGELLLLFQYEREGIEEGGKRL